MLIGFRLGLDRVQIRLRLGADRVRIGFRLSFLKG